MKGFQNKFALGLVFLLLLLVSCSNSVPVDNPTTAAGIQQDNHYIVVLKQAAGNGLQSFGSTKSEIQAFINSNGISGSAVGHIYDYVIKGFSADLTQEQLAKLEKDPNVAFVEKDKQMIIVDQPTIVEGQAKDKTILAQTTPWGITRVGGQSSATSFGMAWIVDTGINLSHPDLNVNTSKSKTFVRSGKDSRSAEDNNGHGTHVSGIIAAKNNTIGVVGVAPNAQVIAVKVLNSQGSGYISDIIAGLNYVYANAANNDVVNCSFGGGISSALDAAISQFATRNDATGPFVWISIAAGNSSANAANYSPARVNGTGIETISAFGNGDVFAYFSNYGNPPIDFSAPGVSIYSCYKNKGYATMSGTSMSAPHVCGIILARIANGDAGTPAINGYVTGDPDGNPDGIAHR